jgi:CIC family chloride channel protein
VSGEHLIDGGGLPVGPAQPVVRSLPRAALAPAVVLTAAVSALAFASLSTWLEHLIDWVAGRGSVVTVAAPALGGMLAVLVVHLARTSPGTTDVYVLGLQRERFDVRSAPARVLALVLGVGSGVPLGYEGPAVYFGGAMGAAAPQWRHRAERPFVLAAATAAVAVVVDAPVAAALFAVEVARRGRPATRDLFPLAAGAVAAWAVLRATGEPGGVLGSGAAAVTPLTVVAGALIGLAGGAVGRGFTHAVRWAKRLALPLRLRLLLVPAVLAVVLLGGQLLADGSPVLFGSGRRLVDHAAAGSLAVSALLLVLFVVVVVAMVAGGVVGGLFLPMLAIGATVGLLVGDLATPGLADGTVVAFGACAVLAAAYGCPLTAVALAASRLGWSPALAVALGAVALARAAAGRVSVSVYQG